MSTDSQTNDINKFIENNLKSRTCKVYNRQAKPAKDKPEDACACGRLIRCHSFSGESQQVQAKKNNKFDWKLPPKFQTKHYSTAAPVSVYGELEFKSNSCQFLRLENQSDPKNVYDYLVKCCEGKKPAMILSVYGGAKYFTMTERLQKEIIRGIIDAATKAEAWILTTGINTGVSKLVGEGISHHRVLKEDSDTFKLVCIGLTMWGTINETTRLELKRASEKYPSSLHVRQIPDAVKENNETIEKNHTHCLLFDNGNLYDYLGDDQRNDLVDVACKDKDQTCYAVTIIVEGGKNTIGVIANDLKNNRPVVLIQGSGRLADVLALLLEQLSNSKTNQESVPTNEDMLKAIDKFFSNLEQEEIKDMIDGLNSVLVSEKRHLLNVFSLNQERSVTETIFNAIFTRTIGNKSVPNAQTIAHDSNQKQVPQHSQEETVQQQKDDDKLLDLALKWNFIDGALPILNRRQDAMIRTGKANMACYRKLFKDALKTDRFAFVEYFLAAGFDPGSLLEIQDQTGSYDTNLSEKLNSSIENTRAPAAGQDTKKASSSKELLLRDLFLWSVFMDMPEMAKVFLVYQPCLICAALIASAILKKFLKSSADVDHKEKLNTQALEFETLAAEFINNCYEYKDELACQLLLREIPLFGGVTCMQVAISSESKKLVETACFDQALTQVWYNKLSLTKRHKHNRLSQFLSLLTLGFLAPLFNFFQEMDTNTNKTSLSTRGINYYVNENLSKGSSWQKFKIRFRYFHQSPLIKMCYHFISYIWFLLVFSYMMLYHLDSPATFRIPHWTEIYIIITVSTMLCEEIRKIYREYRKHMLEQWGSTGSTILTVLTNVFYMMPYFLFYLGLGFRYRGYDEHILATARIIWAFDLEIWYISSLKFLVALKDVGPKLFMLKNMLRDLAAFLYMIFIAIAAYGVVSRALILYKEVPFTASALFKEIFYEPYWFIYGEVSDKNLLDEKILNGSASVAAQATATHIILAFHMLFINILILNLLIAVFTHTIDKVRADTEFYWRYQRYSFIREYFEQPPWAYPPLIFFVHAVLLFLVVTRKLKRRRNQIADEKHQLESRQKLHIFKMIPLNDTQEKWDHFENAATHSTAYSLIKTNKKKDLSTSDKIFSKDSLNTTESDVMKLITEQQQKIANLNKEIVKIEKIVNDNQIHIADINKYTQDHSENISKSLKFIMDAIVRVKMNDPNVQPPKLESSSADETVLTTISDQTA
ncbi:hypothetical protein I4U23_023766 [Adineta vaga]|nr:hypothetical protein I4U23_023766 [Adineta vaga]